MLKRFSSPIILRWSGINRQYCRAPSLMLLTVILLLPTGCHRNPEMETREDFRSYYDSWKVDGSFALYDQSHDTFILYDEDQFTQQFTPASTFKICNSLIALETGVIPDEHYSIPWDGVVRNPVWDRNHDLKSAFQNSTVWYYQEVARRIGGARMKTWLDTAEYGNRDTTGGIDLFWLTGGLRITPEQQISFLRKLHDRVLPFSSRTIDIVQAIMIQVDTADYVLRGKTGWGEQDGREIGWFVGYVEKAKDVYFFSNCIQVDKSELEDEDQEMRFDSARRAIVDSVLTALHIIPQ